MASNRASPKELCLVDGTDGWIYDTSGGLARIVDADFAAADTVTFQDGYFLFNEAGTSRFFISGIDDGTAYSAADFADAESNSDDIVAVFSNQQQILVFKTSVIEIYYNSGNADFPFERVSGGVIQRGCAAAFSIAEEDNTLFFFADDGTIRRIDGSTPVRVSTHAIEEIIREMPTTADAFAYFITISGHKFYHLTFPTGGRTFVYDVATKLWHERESFGQAYFRASFYIRAYGKDLVGDVFAGRIGELDQDTFTEFGGVMQGILTGTPIHKDRVSVFRQMIEVDIESGVGLSGQESPQMWLDYSSDGGETWSAIKYPKNMGKIGERKERLCFWRLGSDRDRGLPIDDIGPGKAHHSWC